ncbi:MAG TPA: hypothetical protein VH501_07365 [Solirubrobacterales bacterium]
MELPLEPPFGNREKRVAYNEAKAREINEQKAEWLERGHASLSFNCECYRDDCGERIRLSAEEWERARAEPNRFAVAPEHVAGEFETVVETGTRFWLIEKKGEAGEEAEKLA